MYKIFRNFEPIGCNDHIGIRENNGIYDVYIYENIGVQKYYLKLFDILNNAKKSDKINIYISSYGGKLMTTIAIVNYIKKCKGTVTTYLNGEGSSCGSILFISGHKRKVLNNSFMMCHYYSSQLSGMGNELLNRTKFDNKRYSKFYKSVYKGFMTYEEIESMINGKEFWMDETEIKKRLKLK